MQVTLQFTITMITIKNAYVNLLCLSPLRVCLFLANNIRPEICQKKAHMPEKLHSNIKLSYYLYVFYNFII